MVQLNSVPELRDLAPVERSHSLPNGTIHVSDNVVSLSVVDCPPQTTAVVRASPSPRPPSETPAPPAPPAEQAATSSAKDDPVYSKYFRMLKVVRAHSSPRISREFRKQL